MPDETPARGLFHCRVLGATGLPITGLALVCAREPLRARCYQVVEQHVLAEGVAAGLPLRVDLATAEEDIAICLVADGLCPVLLPLEDLSRNDGAIDAGDVQLSQGKSVIVHVSCEGSPVPRARIHMGRWKVVWPNGSLLQESTTDESGIAHMPYPSPNASEPFSVEATAARYHDDGPESIGSAPVELELLPATTWSGRIVRASTGEPVDGIEIRALPNPNDRPSREASTWSGRHGEFHFALDSDVRRSAIQVEHLFRRQDLGTFAPGDGLVLTCDLHDVSLRVAGDDHHRPIERYGIRVLSANRQERGSSPVIVAAGFHRGGVLSTRLLGGDYLVQVIPLERGYLPSASLPVRIPRIGPIEIELESAAELIVQCATQDGEPVVGALVQALESVDGKDVSLGSVPATVTLMALDQEPRLLLWDSGVSDEYGAVGLRVPARELVLRAEHEDHVGVLVDRCLPRTQGRTYLTLTLERGGSVVGVLETDVGKAWSRYFIKLVRDYDGMRFPPRTVRHPAKLDSERRFNINSVPPGRWSVHVEFDAVMNRQSLAHVDVRAGETSEVSIRLPGGGWASQRFLFRGLRGDLPTSGSVNMWREEDADDYERVPGRAVVEIRGSGEYSVSLPSGIYRALLLHGNEFWASTGPIRVPSTEERAVVEFARYEVRARLMGVDKVPMAGARVTITSLGRRGVEFHLTADADGLVAGVLQGSSDCLLTIQGSGLPPVRLPAQEVGGPVREVTVAPR